MYKSVGTVYGSVEIRPLASCVSHPNPKACQRYSTFGGLDEEQGAQDLLFALRGVKYCGIGKTPRSLAYPCPSPPPAAQERGMPTLRPGLPPRRYTIASFDNLIVLANHEERLREARKMVWRDRGEPAVEVHDLWECLEHGLRGGLRAS